MAKVRCKEFRQSRFLWAEAATVASVLGPVQHLLNSRALVYWRVSLELGTSMTWIGQKQLSLSFLDLSGTSFGYLADKSCICITTKWSTDGFCCAKPPGQGAEGWGLYSIKKTSTVESAFLWYCKRIIRDKIRLEHAKFYMISNFAIFQVCFSFSVGFWGCLIMPMTEKLYMPGSRSHTGLCMQTVQPILLFITSSVVSYSYLEFKFNV